MVADLQLTNRLSCKFHVHRDLFKVKQCRFCLGPLVLAIRF